MCLYVSRSATPEQAPTPYVTVSTSATGLGTHLLWVCPPDEVPALSHPGSLESEVSFDRPVAPGQGEDEYFQRSPTTSSIETVDEQEPHVVENPPCSLAERAIVERGLLRLQEQKRTIEERAARMAAATKGQSEPDRPVNRNIEGPKLPIGVSGFGREGTWVVEDLWQPIVTPSTDQLPSVREFGEEEEVEVLLSNITQEEAQDLPPNDATQEKPTFNSRSRRLTPLPSFVSGNPMR